MPMSLTLVEAIAGREKAEAVGRDIGLMGWDARHDSQAFPFTRPFALTAIGNTIALWNRERLGLELMPDVDEVSLALVADAWSRTYRSRAVTFSRDDEAILTRNGIRVIPERTTTDWPAERLLPAIGHQQPARALDQALRGIGGRYGIAQLISWPCSSNMRGSATRGEGPAAFSRRCIPAAALLLHQVQPDILGRRALRALPLGALGATPESCVRLLSVGFDESSLRRLVRQ